MADRGELQTVEVTVRGVKTKFRVRGDQVARFKALEEQENRRSGGAGSTSTTGKARNPATSGRQPAAAGGGEVPNK